MALRFPDISGYEAGIPLTGCGAVIIKATEGTSYVNPDYAGALRRAASAGAFAMAYHFLHPGNAAAQAAHCRTVAGGAPLMLDWEQTRDGGQPRVPDATGFIDEFRRLGGTVHLLYLPHWFWARIGSPSLAPLAGRGMALVSSNYTGYSDDGAGWQPYGGMTPAIWQYTSSGTLNGWHPVDFNAFKGTVAELKALATTGTRTPPPVPGHPVWPPGVVLKLGDHGDAVEVLQAALNATHLPGVRNITVDSVFGSQTLQAVREFQKLKGLVIDGIAGPATRAALQVH